MEGKILKGAVVSGAIVRQPVLQAASEAREILDQALAQKARIEREAREQGFREGFQQWDDAIRQAQHAAAMYARQHQQDFLKLSVRIAEKILGGALSGNPDYIAQIVQEALRNLSRERRLTIEVAHGHAATLEAHRPAIESRVGQDCTVRIIESDEVRCGGCLLRSELGVIDARVETQLDLLEKALLDSLAASSAANTPCPTLAQPPASLEDGP